MDELIRFRAEIAEIYGCYSHVHASIVGHHQRLIEVVNGPAPSTAAHGLLFGDGDPNHPDAKYSYRTTFGDAIEVSAPGGVLHTNHARGTIVLVVSTWEHEYRKRIGDEAGLTEPNLLQSDVFADLNRMRQAIVHIGGRLDDEPRAIRIYRRGDVVALTNEDMQRIFESIIDDLNRIGREYFRIDPRFSLYAPLYGPGGIHPARTHE